MVESVIKEKNNRKRDRFAIRITNRRDIDPNTNRRAIGTEIVDRNTPQCPSLRNSGLDETTTAETSRVNQIEARERPAGRIELHEEPRRSRDHFGRVIEQKDP